MDNLDKQSASWRRRFLNDSAFYSDEVEELESHLRDAVDRLVAQGYTEREAFLEATRLLGDLTLLRREYKNSRPLVEWLFVPAVVVAVAAFLLPILIDFLVVIDWWQPLSIRHGATPLSHPPVTPYFRAYTSWPSSWWFGLEPCGCASVANAGLL